MFTFTGKPPVTTTIASTIFNPTSTFSSANASQPWTIFGTSSTSQPFTLAANAQNTTTINPFPFGNPPTSTTPANFTPPNIFGTSVFGTNQKALVTQPGNVFPSNLTGTTVPFGAVSAQGTFPIASTTSSIFGTNNTTTTTTAIPFGTTFTTFNTSGNLFNQAFPTASVTTTPWNVGTSVAPPVNIFGTSISTIPNPFDNKPFTTPSTTSVFSSTTKTNPFVTQPVTTQSPFNFQINTSTSTPFVFGPQPAASTNIFSQSTTATSSSSIARITTTNIFGVPISTATTVTPAFPVLNPTVPTTTTTASTFTPQWFQSIPVTQTPPAVTSSASPTVSQSLTQEQNVQQTASIIQQQFLAASLLDPYANRGKKDFTNIDQIQVFKEASVISTLSTPTITTAAPIPATLPIQSNFQKVPSSRSSIDVNFKLKPVSSSPTLNDDIKPSNQQSTASIGQIKSKLKGNFTDEEELVLLSRTKMSKLRLSNDMIDSSYQSNTIRSLYPVRRLVELEKLTNLTPSSSPTTTANNERTSHPSTENCNISSNHRSIPSVIPKQSSSPIVQRKSNNNVSTYQLPILTRDDYYMKPNLTELKPLFNDQGQCILTQFTVGHEKYGSVTFYGQINVAGLNLDKIIEINHQEVIVYPDDNNKPSVGEELNLPARITLLGVYPIDRTTREEITDMERIKAMNYHDHLREITKKFDGEFLKYGINDGSWTFMVKHFTRYGLDGNQDDVVIQLQQHDTYVNLHNHQPSLASNSIDFDKTIVE